jgi:hypothetical protein
MRGALPRFLRRPAEPDYEGQVRGRLSRVAFTPEAVPRKFSGFGGDIFIT